MASGDLDSFINPNLLEIAFKDLVKKLPEVPINDDESTKTLYNIIKNSPNSTTFTRFIERHPRLLSLFQDPNNGEHTIFLPVDSSWEASPQEPVADVLAAHISPHYVTTEGLLHMPNVPTILTLAQSNGPHIVRTRFSAEGWQLDQTARIFEGNIIAKNGVIHWVDRVIPPPPDTLGVLKFSRDLSLVSKAIQLSEVQSEFRAADIKGRTLFTPTDAAFQDLGSPILSFLFDTGAGRPYLKTLLKLHFCPNITFFSNFIWPKNVTGARQTSADTPRRIKGKRTQSIPTMALALGGGPANVSVTLARFNGLISMLINDSVKVVLQDLATSDGVVQVIDRVLLSSSITGCAVGGQHLSLGQFKECIAGYMLPEELSRA